MEKITYKKIKQMQEVNAYIEQGNHVLGVLGYTEHSLKHAAKVAETAGKILQKPIRKDVRRTVQEIRTVAGNHSGQRSRAAHRVRAS